MVESGIRARLQELDRERAAATERQDWPALEYCVERIEQVLLEPGLAAMPVARLVGVRNVAAQVRRLLFTRRGTVTDLERALELWGEALGISRERGEVAYQANFHNNLAFGLNELYSATGEREFFDDAFRHAERAVELTPPDSPDHISHLGTLAIRCGNRYRLTGDLADLDRSVALLESMLTRARQPGIRAKIRHNLAASLSDRFRHGNDLDDALRARELTELALKHTDVNDPERVDTLNSLAVRLLDLAKVRDDGSLLPQALDHLAEALRGLDPRSPRYLAVRHNEASGRSDMYHRTGDLQHLDHAVDIMRAVTKATHRDDPQYAARWADLGERYYERHLASGAADDWAAAARAFHEACQAGTTVHPAVALQAGRAWGDAALTKGSWAQADSALDHATAAVDTLWRAQVNQTYRDSWLVRTVGVHARAAYAAARTGDVRKAAVRLEHGRAFALSEKLALVQVELDRLEALGHAGLRHRFVTARDRLFSTPDTDHERIRALQSELSAAAAAIAVLDGFEGFLQPPTFEKTIAPIVRTGAHTVLVYLGATRLGGLGVVVPAEGEPSVLWLDSLTEEYVADLYSGFARAYGRRLVNATVWEETLESVCGRLGETVMSPLVRLLESLPGPGTGTDKPALVLVPQGLLGSLPLHAAAVTSAQGEPESHVLDHVESVAYAPNARAVRATSRSASTARAALAAHNTGDGLKFSRAETRMVARRLQGPSAVVADPSAADVLDHLRSDRLVHLAVHGLSDPYAPLDSRLLLSRGALSLKEILAVREDVHCDVAVLSACETGVPGKQLPDETVSLAVGLLHTGVAGVVSSQWAVRDSATLLLMVKLYESLAVPGTTVAAALCSAQKWLRDAPYDDLAALLDETGGHLPPSERTAFLEAARDARWEWDAEEPRPFRGLRHWAPFTFTGTHQDTGGRPL